MQRDSDAKARYDKHQSGNAKSQQKNGVMQFMQLIFQKLIFHNPAPINQT